MLHHRIYIDLQAAQSVAHAERGIARYSIELTRALLRAGAPVAAIGLSPHLPSPRGLPDDVASSPLLTQRTAASITRASGANPLAYQVMSPIELELPPLRTIPESAMQRADAFVAVVYDLIPLVFPDRYLVDPHLRRRYLARLDLLRRADLLLAISEHTRRDVIAHLGVDAARVVTIGGGVAEHFHPRRADEDPRVDLRAAIPAIDRPFVLTVSGWDWRKNTENLIRAFAALPAGVRRELQLVVACAVPPEGASAWRDEARRAGIGEGQFVITGYVDENLLRSLYQRASLFVFPSRYEGFGLPVAEAARCGAPVLTSDTSSLPEILDLPQSTFPPDDVDAIGAAIERALTDEDLRAELRAAGGFAAAAHTWDHVAQRTIAAYEHLEERVLQPSRSRRRPMRLRVGFVGPLPPVESGIAIYNRRLLEALHEDIDVHVFVDGTLDAERPEADVRVYPVAALDDGLDPYDYDVLVHTIGNNIFHVRSFELARRHPGVLWLHDVSLVGLHLEWANWQQRTGRTSVDTLSLIREELVREYGTAVPLDELLQHPFSHRPFAKHGVLLSAGLVRAARHVIVNSSVAARMVEADARRPPSLTVLPLAVPSRSTHATHAAPVPRPRPLVVALGVVHEVKRPDVLIHALARVHPRSDLVFVGPCGDDAETLVREAIDTAALEGRVTITGFVDEREYERWLEQADCVVQLRDVSFGESSATVNDAIAAGVPVVTSIASCADLPADVVELVPPDVSSADLAKVITTILNDSDRRAAMQVAEAKYAAEWTFERVASELATVVRRVAGNS